MAPHPLPLSVRMLLLVMSLAISSGYWSPFTSAAVNTPGHCEIVKPGYLQPVATSANCTALFEWNQAHPEQIYSNPYTSTAYNGSTGHYVGRTASNKIACCQGRGQGCAGSCPCASNILHCTLYDTQGTCINVQQCEVPPQYIFVPDTARSVTSWVVIFIAVLVSVVGVVAILIAVLFYCKRRQQSPPSSVMWNGDGIEISEEPSISLVNPLMMQSHQ